MADRVTVLWGTGKRKSSVARVRLQPGDGTIVVNDRPLDNYFGRETSRMIVQQPFEVTSTQGSYRADVNVCGGGVSAQAVAIRHGITRALLEATRLPISAQEGRLHHGGLPRGRAQEVRS